MSTTLMQVQRWHTLQALDVNAALQAVLPVLLQREDTLTLQLQTWFFSGTAEDTRDEGWIQQHLLPLLAPAMGSIFAEVCSEVLCQLC